MPQAPSTGSSLIRDPSIAHRNTQILWTEADRDLAQDTRFTGMKQRESNYRYIILRSCKLSTRVSLKESFRCGKKSIVKKIHCWNICKVVYALCTTEMPACVVSILFKEFLVTDYVASETIVYYLFCLSDTLKDVVRYSNAAFGFRELTWNTFDCAARSRSIAFSVARQGISWDFKDKIVVPQILLTKRGLHCTNQGISNVIQDV